jgi:hypothetical protein
MGITPYKEIQMKTKLKKTYNFVGDFIDGIARVKKGRKWGFIDHTEKVIVEPKYDAVGFFCEGFARVKVFGKYGFVNKTGEEIIKPKYKEVGYFDKGFVEVICPNERYGKVDTRGNEYFWGDQNA